MSLVSSRQHAIVKQARAILKGEDRHVLLDGWHLVEDALGAGLRMPWVAIDLARPPHDPALVDRLIAHSAMVYHVTASVMDAMSPVRTPAGIVAIAERPAIALDAMLTPPPPLVVAACGLQDPGNVGALARSADAAGATGLLLDGHSADPWSWKALRGSMGSAFRMPMARDADAASHLRTWQARGLAIIATDPHAGQVMHEVDFTSPCVLVFGSEGLGVPADTMALADTRVRIPMRPPVESLNVAVAAALLVYEAARQRGTLQ